MTPRRALTFFLSTPLNNSTCSKLSQSMNAVVCSFTYLLFFLKIVENWTRFSWRINSCWPRGVGLWLRHPTKMFIFFYYHHFRLNLLLCSFQRAVDTQEIGKWHAIKRSLGLQQRRIKFIFIFVPKEWMKVLECYSFKPPPGSLLVRNGNAALKDGRSFLHLETKRLEMEMKECAEECVHLLSEWIALLSGLPPSWLVIIITNQDEQQEIPAGRKYI